MDILKKLDDLKKKNNWTDYRIAKEAGLADTTIANIFSRRALPHMDTLEAICRAFGLTLSQFFFDADQENVVILTKEQAEFFNRWESLPDAKKKLVMHFMDFLDTIR